MKKKIIISAVAAILVIAIAAAVIVFGGFVNTGKSSQDGSLWIGSSKFARAGKIMLYGERHANEAILAKEIELWQDYYHNEGMRHLFIEMPYYTGQYLNRWMKAEDNTYLDKVYADWKGSLAHAQCVYDFYVTIKETCPETIFHATDVGHQYQTTGASYLALLLSEGKEDTEEYRLTKECMDQGKKYYGDNDTAYRENCMTANFIREFDALGGNTSIMGIYGGAHVPLTSFINMPLMGKDLYAVYGDAMFSLDLGEGYMN